MFVFLLIEVLSAYSYNLFCRIHIYYHLSKAKCSGRRGGRIGDYGYKHATDSQVDLYSHYFDYDVYPSFIFSSLLDLCLFVCDVMCICVHLNLDARTY